MLFPLKIALFLREIALFFTNSLISEAHLKVITIDLIFTVFENKEKMVLVMEIAAGGELYDFLSERKCLEENEARRIFRQIATAVYYCHKHNICHRDLKLENILLDENGCAKVSSHLKLYAHNNSFIFECLSN